jgi:uncharacterized protein YndB with AHSA1/START domain
MPVVHVEKSQEQKKLVLTSEWSASIANVWQLWANPRLLERWWGPPGFPTTFDDYDLTAGGTITYLMVTPDGADRFHGRWKIVEVDAPTRLVVADADLDADGVPADGNGLTHIEVDIEPAGDKTRMTVTARFDSIAGMEQQLAMDFEEGMKACMGQIDAVLAEVRA